MGGKCSAGCDVDKCEIAQRMARQCERADRLQAERTALTRSINEMLIKLRDEQRMLAESIDISTSPYEKPNIYHVRQRDDVSARISTLEWALEQLGAKG